MNFYVIEPEVAGALGENTVMDRTIHPPQISKLQYKFDGWLGDVLLESFPCFIITQKSAQLLKMIHPTGVDFCDVEITSSEEFQEFHPDERLPEFLWLKPLGKAGADDFATAPDHRLIVSERVLDILKSLGLKNALVEPFNP